MNALIRGSTSEIRKNISLLDSPTMKKSYRLYIITILLKGVVSIKFFVKTGDNHSVSELPLRALRTDKVTQKPCSKELFPFENSIKRPRPNTHFF